MLQQYRGHRDIMVIWWTIDRYLTYNLHLNESHVLRI